MKPDTLMKKLEIMNMKVVNIVVQSETCKWGYYNMQNTYPSEQNMELANMVNFN